MMMTTEKAQIKIDQVIKGSIIIYSLFWLVIKDYAKKG
jgi:hypothetical protein